MAKRTSFEGMTEGQRVALAGRIRLMVETIGTQAIAAKVAGLSVDQLGRLLSAKSAPTFLAVARLAEASNVNLAWVATGKGPRRYDPAGYEAEPHHPGSAQRLIDTIRSLGPTDLDPAIITSRRYAHFVLTLRDGIRNAYARRGRVLTESEEDDATVPHILKVLAAPPANPQGWHDAVAEAIVLEIERAGLPPRAPA